ncbi:MAG TPA: SDR family NAD(P)-dependent oxidoreductase [Acidimicrobiales bacterium]|jgi:NAD(P)-dependent dehydrogenase (short-subunit alcohol dehydrogenase family)
MGLLDGKVAIVTGAGHGIGRGHALELAREGARVVVNDLGGSVTGEGKGRDADVVVGVIAGRGGQAVANYADVADFSQAEEMVQQAIDTYGQLDILVNNAGIVRDGMLWKITEDDWDAVIRVHLKGTFAPLHHAAKHWSARFKETGRKVGARVINTTSGAGLEGNIGQINYTTAKGGIASLTITASLELFRMGVTVNCLAPAGATRISATIPGAGIEAKEPDEFGEFSPMDPSLGSPVVAWLASEEAAHVTGQVIRVVGEDINLLTPWDYGPGISKPGERWDPAELTAKMNAHVFGTRHPGLRSMNKS